MPSSKFNNETSFGTVLYVIGPKRGPVKIGISASPANRMASLQTSHPYELSILAEIPIRGSGIDAERHQLGTEVERRVHEFLLPYRTRASGEWFNRSHEVQQFIDMAKCKLSPDMILAKLKIARVNRLQEWAQANGEAPMLASVGAN